MSKNKKTVTEMIADNYKELERSIARQLQINSQHSGTIGGFREEVWKSLFAQIIPKKFSIARSVFIIDSQGQVSAEVDLAIFDEQYTPYIFNYGELKYIPIEAVAAAIQCKSTSFDKSDVEPWVDSINNLKTSLKSIARMYSNMAVGEFEYVENEEGKFIVPTESKSPKEIYQTGTRPILILCHMNQSLSQRSTINEIFDILLRPKGERLEVSFYQDPEVAEPPILSNWYLRLNHHQECYSELRKEWKGKPSELTLDNYKVNDPEDPNKEIALLSLIFQLNQLLMLINNPIPFPHMAYVEMFNSGLKKDKQ
ncbi:DUF6602 domain-containing protein [Amphibacillus cookii]|uniref:DUF6602 domain-containing protein n=1 Tax=Amphibacillus cookii TaxID=767787 RepID=UPI00195DC72D|nr:DUF6602 domain-containing protein [Amphibacillus cookii]MBM7541839.1 hypothetical protein [Amphibacillus cookii]